MAQTKNAFVYNDEEIKKRMQQNIAANPTGLLTPTEAAKSNLVSELNKEMGYTHPGATSTLTTPAYLSSDRVEKYTPGQTASGNAGPATSAGTKKTYTYTGNAQKQKAADQLNALYGQIMGRGPFKYDMNADPLYKQMAAKYVQMGQQAMMDAMGQAATLTGGYGNSFAQNAGQQAYQQWLTSLNEQVPSLYQQAYNVWGNEGERLLQLYELAAAHPEYLSALKPASYVVTEQAPQAVDSTYLSALQPYLGNAGLTVTAPINALAGYYDKILEKIREGK